MEPAVGAPNHRESRDPGGGSPHTQVNENKHTFYARTHNRLRTHDRSMKHAKRENEHACTCAHARENMSKKLASDTMYINTPRAPEPIPILGLNSATGRPIYCTMVQSSKVHFGWKPRHLRKAGCATACTHIYARRAYGGNRLRLFLVDPPAAELCRTARRTHSDSVGRGGTLPCPLFSA